MRHLPRRGRHEAVPGRSRRPAERVVQICHKPGPTPATGGTTGETGGGAAQAIPHPIDGDTYKDCTTCHGADKMKPFPANHASFPPTAARLPQAPQGRCDAAGRRDTRVCEQRSDPGDPAPDRRRHVQGLHDVPRHGQDEAVPGESRELRHGWLHSLPPAGSTGEAAPERPPQQPRHIPHPTAGDAFKDCTICHGADKMKPFPANHASFADR